jgi:hypothetical protein
MLIEYRQSVIRITFFSVTSLAPPLSPPASEENALSGSGEYQTVAFQEFTKLKQNFMQRFETCVKKSRMK